MEQDNIRISEIKIGKRFRKDLGNLENLKNSIKEIGLLQSIVIDENNNLVAGARRIEIFKQLNKLEIPFRRISIKNILKGEYDENTIRKDFTPSEAVAILESLKSKQGQLLSDSDRSEGRRQKAVKITGRSHDSLSKAKQVVESKNEKVIQEMDKTGNINKAYRQIRQIEAKENQPAMPKNKFQIILADPPWKYEHPISDSRRIENQYPTMDLEEIKALKIPAEDNAVLFLWATAPKLEESLEVMKAWNFNYRTCAIWNKMSIGPGYWFRNQHELLLIGTKGKVNPPEPTKRVSSVFSFKRTEHSKKPEYVYELIEKLFPNSSYLELFARNKRIKWISWGLDLPKI